MSVREEPALASDVGDGILRLRLPMADNPLRFVNGYLIEEDDGYTLVDCGWKTDDVLAAVHEGLGDLGLTLADVRRIAITHVHFDHYGLAGTLRRAGVPELLMHPLEWDSAQRILSDASAADAYADAWIARNGFVAETGLEDELHHRRTELAEPTQCVEDGERVGRLVAVWTPGHTRGHLCFLDTRSRRLLTGDHVLDPVTPHVGCWFPERGDALGEYVASLRIVRELPGVTGALPAHGEPFDDLARRVDQLLAHESAREERVVAALRTGPLTAAEVAGALPWTRRETPFAALANAHQQFAVAETLAHLEYLRARGLATRDEAGDPIRYALAE